MSDSSGHLIQRTFFGDDLFLSEMVTLLLIYSQFRLLYMWFKEGHFLFHATMHFAAKLAGVSGICIKHSRA